MGSGRYDADAHTVRQQSKRDAGQDAFVHDQRVRQTGVFTVHPDLDPKKLNTASVQLRESRDSDEHPNSLAIAVLFDETGSMGSVPRTMLEKLPQLHGLIERKDYVEGAQILFGALGDAFSDRVPLQIGQFESDNRQDANLESFYLESNGGGQEMESYELAMFFMARFTALDCFEKRDKRGYLFIIGDEMSHPVVRREQVKEIIGVDLEADIPLQDILAELQTKFDVFFLMSPTDTYGEHAKIFQFWRDLLGERAIHLEDPGAVCETIALTLGVCEGTIDLSEGLEHLEESGTNRQLVATVSRALETVGAGAGAVARSSGSLSGLDE